MCRGVTPMASQTQFKQQCPSCEAMVRIVDAGLVGKKVDCPKCKYRFVVEDPGVADTDDGDEKGTSTKLKTKPDSARLKAGGKKSKGKGKPDDNGDLKGKKKDKEK